MRYIFPLIIIFFSCSKKASDSSMPVTESNLVGKYLITRFDVNGGDQLAISIPSCKRDNTIEYLADHRYIVQETWTVCPGSVLNDTLEKKTWSLNGDILMIGTEKHHVSKDSHVPDMITFTDTLGTEIDIKMFEKVH